MGKMIFTREEMAAMIDILNSMATDEKYLSVHTTRNCPFWENAGIREECSEKSCLFCISNNMIAFLENVKDVFIKGKSPIDTLTEEKSTKAETTKIRLYSNEDYINDTLDWLALTDEQLRLFNYLFNNGYLADEISYDECGEPEFKTI